MSEPAYTTHLPGGQHWSLRLRRGTTMRLTAHEPDTNVGMLMYNPENLLERLNLPDTLKCQHTFKLTRGHCLYSDMGRIFASIIDDDLGWHDSVGGNLHARHMIAPLHTHPSQGKLSKATTAAEERENERRRLIAAEAARERARHPAAGGTMGSCCTNRFHNGQ